MRQWKKRENSKGPRHATTYFPATVDRHSNPLKFTCPLGQGRVRSSDAFLVFGGVVGRETARARPPLGPQETKLEGPMSGAGAGAHQLLL